MLLVLCVVVGLLCTGPRILRFLLCVTCFSHHQPTAIGCDLLSVSQCSLQHSLPGPGPTSLWWILHKKYSSWLAFLAVARKQKKNRKPTTDIILRSLSCADWEKCVYLWKLQREKFQMLWWISNSEFTRVFQRVFNYHRHICMYAYTKANHLQEWQVSSWSLCEWIIANTDRIWICRGVFVLNKSPVVCWSILLHSFNATWDINRYVYWQDGDTLVIIIYRNADIEEIH